MPVMALKTTEWAQVAAPVFAAFAAGASWAAVRQSHKAFATSQLPQLIGDWDNDAEDAPSLVIHNTGGGVAYDPYFYVLDGDSKVDGRIVKTGPLLAGRGATVFTRFAKRPPGSSDPILGVLFCRDWQGHWHVWSWDGRHKLLRHASPTILRADALHALYPETKDRAFTTVGWAYTP